MGSLESLVRLVPEDTRELRECLANLERMAYREKREIKDHLEKILSAHRAPLEDKVSQRKLKAYLHFYIKGPIGPPANCAPGEPGEPGPPGRPGQIGRDGPTGIRGQQGVCKADGKIIL
jgi:hypothetical protein